MPAKKTSQDKLAAIVERLSRLLEERSLSHRDLAKNSGMKDSAITRILQGKTNLTIRTISRLEKGLGEQLIVIP